MSEPRSDDKSETITIKKYANRRLYNTATSSYVTLDHLCKMVKERVDFVVYDAKSGEDITRPVLTQIIVEEESKGQNLLPIAFLRQLIGFYGDNMQWMVPSYLEHMMTALSSNQDRMRQTVQETFGGLFPFGNLDEVGKQNMALFENAIKAFAPTTLPVPPGGESEAEETATPDRRGAAAEAGDSDALRALQQQVDLLQKQLESLSIQDKRDGEEENG